MRYKLEKYEPLDLLIPERLDLVVKYLYIKAKIEGENFEYFKNLYIKHINKRTGGKQYIYEYIDGKHIPKSIKTNVDDYLNDFDKLIDSFISNGFNKEYFIPISGMNRLLLDGSHRASCSLYFNESPFVKIENRLGKKWDYIWFKINDFKEDEINNILNTYIELKIKNIFAFILWSPVEEHWDNIEREIMKNRKIVFSKDYTFSVSGFKEIVYEVYSYEFGIKLPENIDKKLMYLKEYGPKLRLIFLEIEKPQYIEMRGGKICNQILNIKNEIRDKYDSIVEKEKFITIHTTDNAEHSEHLRRIFMSSKNLKDLNRRRMNSYREVFLEWLEEYIATLDEWGISVNDCCIVGSGPMEVLGIRDSTDIDFILHSNIRDKLFDEKSKALSENVDVVHKGYHEYNNDFNPISDDDIIMNSNYHFYFRGLKFVNIEIVRDRKANHKRPKDVTDIGLIDKFIKNTNIESN